MEGDKSPEYRAISLNRGSLEKQLASHLRAIAEKLRDNELLNSDQCEEIKSKKEGQKQLVNAILLAIEVDPVRLFWEVIELMKACGNRVFQTFIEKTVEMKRKAVYRDYLARSGCDEAKKCDVFICYGQERDTTNEKVDQIAKHLGKEGLEIFVDRSTLRPGSLWSAETIGAIRNCRAFVAVLTKKFVRSNFCHGELYEADAHKKPFYPVVLEGDWESEVGAKPVVDILTERYQWTSFTTEQEIEENLPKLVDAITTNLRPKKRVQVQNDGNNEGASPRKRQRDETDDGSISVKKYKVEETSALDTELKLNNIDVILPALKNVAVKWFFFGLALGVDYNDLEGIQQNNRDCETCLQQMLALRLRISDRNGPLTWRVICTGLRKSTVQRNDVAVKIESTFTNCAQGSSQTSPCTLGCVTQQGQHILSSRTSETNNEKSLHLTQKQEQVSKSSDVDMADGTQTPLEALCLNQGVQTEELGKEVSEEDILEMYQKLEKYEQVARHLGLKNPDIEEIEHKYMRDIQLIKMHVLKKWRSKNIILGTCTYKVLLEALLKCECEDSAIRVCEVLKSKR